MTLCFQVSRAVVAALDTEAARLTVERGPGASRVTRAEMVRVVLALWIAAQPHEQTSLPERLEARG